MCTIWIVGNNEEPVFFRIVDSKEEAESIVKCLTKGLRDCYKFEIVY